MQSGGQLGRYFPGKYAKFRQFRSGAEKKRRPDDLRFFGITLGGYRHYADSAREAGNVDQTRAAFSAALSVGLGRITALHLSESAL